MSSLKLVEAPIPVPEKDPTGKSVGDMGAKVDEGKPKVYSLFIKYFPNAIKEVARVSEAGMKKGYSWKSWYEVQNGEERYADAMMRHVLDELDDPISTEGKMCVLHAAQTAWNAMARLELILTKGDKDGEQVRTAECA